MTSATEITISTATTADVPAIRRLVPAEHTTLLLDVPDECHSGLQDDLTCLVAKQDDEVRGILLARWLAPFVGSITGPILARQDEASARALLAEVTSRFQHAATRVVSTLRPPDDPLTSALQQAGFQVAARISFMVATRFQPLPTHATAAITANVVRPDQGPQRRRWQGVLDGTFEQTLDCPVLRRAMSAEDTIATFEKSSFDEQQWLIATHDDQDVGCLILGFDNEEQAAEILYLGVVSSFRTRGYGRQLLQVAFSAARQRKCRRLGLGVDASNPPAVSLYNKSGFYEYDQRDLFVHVLKT
jgi:GNAT superfamily N-acetyltransferase